MTQIEIRLKFNEYSFSRAKPTSSNSAIAYTKTSWVGKEVLIIPLPLNITDRWIEKHKKDDEYQITIQTDTILKKTIKRGSNIGRVYLPSDMMGVDCLIIEAPKLNNF